MRLRLLESPLSFVALSTLVACAKLTAPGSHTKDLAQTEESPEPAKTATAEPPPPPAPPTAPEGESVRASHILVAFEGALRAKPDVKRSKADARKRADEIAARAKKGEDFAKLAEELSDGPTGPRGGDLGRFTRERMVKPFADAAFDLQPGQVSDVVETNFGFHVIKRTE